LRPTALTAPRPDGFAYVVTDDLRMRSKPEVSDASGKYEPLLWKGALAWVAEGPIRGSGYDWYRIVPLGEVDLQYHPDPPPEGMGGGKRQGRRAVDCRLGCVPQLRLHRSTRVE
jgi:hypothetical protein